MKIKILLPLVLLAAAPLQAITLTIQSSLDVWSIFDPDHPPPWGLTGYEDVAVGDPVAFRITFDETLLLVPTSTDPAVFNGVIDSFEFMLGGEPKITFTDLNVTVRNGYQGQDTFQISSPPVSRPTVVGLHTWSPRGVANLTLVDHNNNALVAGQPIDFARFFDDPDDGFIGGAQFETGSPYSGFGPRIHGRAKNPASLWTPPASSVPDSGSTTPLVTAGLALLVGCRRIASRQRQGTRSSLSA